MSCRGRGLCRCGRPECLDAITWVSFVLFWRDLAMAIEEERNAIAYYTELIMGEDAA